MANNTRSSQSGSSMQSRNQVSQTGQAQRSPSPQPSGGSKQNLEQKANQVSEQVAQKAQSSFDNARTTVTQQFKAVARAIELGVNYFDTAASYGNGQSETNLGQTLKALGARVETKLMTA